MLNKVTAVLVTVTVPGVPVIDAVVPVDASAPVAMSILLPGVLKTRLPLVAVILPAVEVIPVPAVIVDPADIVVPDVNVVVVVNEPGAVMAAGRDSVVVPADVEAVIWAAVPLMAKIVPEEEESCTQVAERIPPAVESPIN